MMNRFLVRILLLATTAVIGAVAAPWHQYILVSEKGKVSRYSQLGWKLPHYCNWPTPYDLATIEPTFLVRSRAGDVAFNISSTDQIQDMVATMQQEKVLRKQVLFVIHGYEDNIDTPWLYEMSDALLAVDDFTVIVTGWGKGADFWVNYGQAASNTQTVSAAVAQIAQKLREAASPYLYCIGHSLGAHVCGQAGNDFKFNRISGLDPAGPGFQYCPLNPGLTNSSADCVDVLHTNGESYDGFGRLDPLGHIDFYPSCGKTQPGCMRIEVGCSHDKAIYDFIGTINASMSDPFAYPVGEGPCDDDFIDNCQPCNDYTCPSAEPTCGNNQQPVGFLSACSNTRQLPCGSLAREEYFGKWFVPVTKSGFDMFCTRSSRVRS